MIAQQTDQFALDRAVCLAAGCHGHGLAIDQTATHGPRGHRNPRRESATVICVGRRLRRATITHCRTSVAKRGQQSAAHYEPCTVMHCDEIAAHALELTDAEPSRCQTVLSFRDAGEPSAYVYMIRGAAFPLAQEMTEDSPCRAARERATVPSRAGRPLPASRVTRNDTAIRRRSSRSTPASRARVPSSASPVIASGRQWRWKARRTAASAGSKPPSGAT